MFDFVADFADERCVNVFTSKAGRKITNDNIFVNDLDGRAVDVAQLKQKLTDAG